MNIKSLMKDKLKFIPNIVLIISGISLFQTVGVFEETYCKKLRVKNNVGIPGKTCEFIRKSKITFPSNFILENSKNLNKLIAYRSSSGNIIKGNKEQTERFSSLKPNFTFNYPKGSKSDSGFLLLSTADPLKDGEPLIELWDLNAQKLIYKWEFNTNKILKEVGILRKSNSIRFLHPLLLKDGNIATTIIWGPLMKLSPMGELVKVNNEYEFHHSLEIDSQENIYVPIRKKLSSIGNRGYEEGFAIVDQNLNIKKTFFLKDIYEKAGLNYQIYAPELPIDPFHLNDVQPLLSLDNTRVVFLSLRNQSTILAFDLIDEKIIWLLQGYSSFQHDIDIIEKDGSAISIFDNNNEFTGKGLITKKNLFTIIENLPSISTNNKSELLIFNNAGNSFIEKDLIIKQENFSFLDNKLIPISHTNGLAEFIKNNNSIFIEETNYGRLFEYEQSTKKLLWQYININESNKNIYSTSWSRRLRVLPKDLIEKLSNIK